MYKELVKVRTNKLIEGIMKKFAAAAVALLFLSGCGIVGGCAAETMTKDGPVCAGAGNA